MAYCYIHPRLPLVFHGKKSVDPKRCLPLGDEMSQAPALHRAGARTAADGTSADFRRFSRGEIGVPMKNRGKICENHRVMAGWWLTYLPL